jgi:hypothetical protein
LYCINKILSTFGIYSCYFEIHLYTKYDFPPLECRFMRMHLQMLFQLFIRPKIESTKFTRVFSDLIVRGQTMCRTLRFCQKRLATFTLYRFDATMFGCTQISASPVNESFETNGTTEFFHFFVHPSNVFAQPSSAGQNFATCFTSLEIQ